MRMVVGRVREEVCGLFHASMLTCRMRNLQVHHLGIFLEPFFTGTEPFISSIFRNGQFRGAGF